MLRCRSCGLVMEANQAATGPEVLRWSKHRWMDVANHVRIETLVA